MNKVQTGLRIPEEQYEKLRQAAERSGVSINSQILYLIDIGLRVLDLGVQALPRESAHTQQDTDE